MCEHQMGETQFAGRLQHPGTGAPVQVIVDECASCRGIWFDRYELEATIGLRSYMQHLLQVAGSFQPSGNDCPGCQFPLQRVEVGQASFEICRGCQGCWLGAGVVRELHDELMARRVALGGTMGACACARCQQHTPAAGLHFASEGPMCQRCFDIVLWNEHRVAQAPLANDLETSESALGAAGAVGLYAGASFAEILVGAFVEALIDG